MHGWMDGERDGGMVEKGMKGGREWMDGWMKM